MSPTPRARRGKRARNKFRQIDVTRAIRAAKAAGIEVGRVEIDADGKIVIATASETPQATLTPLQEWKAKRARAS